MIDLLIRKLEQLEPFNDAERTSLHEMPIRMVEYERGDVIVRQGDQPIESALVMSGFAFRSKILPDGSRQIVSVQIPGDFVDLHSFVLRPLDHAIAAASNSKVGRVPHSAIMELIEKHPRIARALMWDMAVDAAVTREWLANIGRRSAYEQLAHLFCELYFRMKWAGQVSDKSFELPLIQSELADACGLSKVHVNRSLQSLRKDDLIILEGHRLTVPDIDKLVQAIHFDPSYLHLLD